MNTYPHELPIDFLYHRQFPQSETYEHETYDILYIPSGQCYVNSNTTTLLYPEGSIRLFSPGTRYTLESDGNGFYLLLGIREDFIFQNLPEYGSLLCDSVREPGNDYSDLKELVSVLSIKYLEDSKKNRLLIQGMLYQLLSIVEKNYFHGSFSKDLPEKYEKRIQEITDYIDTHYTEPLTLSDLAEELYLTPQYLSRFFKDYLHKNFKDYLTEKRLYHAYRQLCFTNDPVTDIALHCGFANATVFGKTFRNLYHMTPSECRKNYRQKKLEQEYSPADTMAREMSPDPVPNHDESFLMSQHVEVSVRKSYESVNHYCALINIGSVHNLLIQDFQHDLALAKREMEIQYVRIQEIISSSFIPKVLPDYKFYFHNLDSVFWALHDMDLIPFIELSELPYDYDSFFDSGTPFTFRGKRFFELLEIFLEHCSSTFPEEWTSLWKFELWMNPTDTAQTYAADFKRIQDLLGRNLPGASFGGFGIASGFSKDELDMLLKELRMADFQPDFISAHFSLQVNTEKKHFHVSTDHNLLPAESQLAKELIHHYYPEMPFYLSEWTSLFFSDIPVHYSCYQAAFVCHTIASLSPYYDLMGYWTFAERALPSSMNRQTPSIWGHGLLDRNRLKMPAYHAFAFLSRLGDQEIQRGQNFMISQSAPNHYQVLAFHYAHFNAENTLQNDTLTSFANIYQLFEDSHPQRMHFTLQDLDSGTYQIRRYFLNRANGSILDILIGGFLNSNINETEYLMKVILPPANTVRYYHDSCVPEERTIYLEATDSLHVFVDLLPHNVCLFDIIRLY